MTRTTRYAAMFGLSAFLATAGLAIVQTPGPNAGEQSRAIKSLSPKEIDDLAQGRGMGLAKAAELNRYPGPMHSLELALQLQLTVQQREGLQASFARMSSRARSVGLEVLSAERELDSAFASRSIDASKLVEVTSRIGAKQAELRAVHLQAHLETAALLLPEQIARYDALRGYDGNAPAPAPVHGAGKP